MDRDYYNDPFTPETVDEQVDRLSRQTEALQPVALTLNERVVRGLYSIYEEDKRSTERVWQRLTDHVTAQTVTEPLHYRQQAPLDGSQREQYPRHTSGDFVAIGRRYLVMVRGAITRLFSNRNR